LSALGTYPSFSLIAAMSAYVFKLVRGRVKSLELYSPVNDPIATFLYPQNGAFSMLVLKPITQF
jgi:hypothetical protein